MSKQRRPNPDAVSDMQEALLVRVRKLRRKGELRKAATALREACLREEGAASLWTMYGALLAEIGRVDDARQALRHALWLRRSSGDVARERSTRSLLDRLEASAAA